MQDNRPDQAQSQFGVSIDNVLGSNINQFNLLITEKVQGHLSILQHMETHFTLFSWLKEQIELN